MHHRLAYIFNTSNIKSYQIKNKQKQARKQIRQLWIATPSNIYN